MRRHAVGLIVPLVLGFLVVPLAVEAQPSAKLEDLCWGLTVLPLIRT